MFSHSGQRLESQNFWNSSMSICDILELKVTSPTVPFLMSLQEEDPKRSGDQSIDRLASCQTNDRSASHLCSQCTSIHDVYRSLPPMHPEHPGRRVPKRHPRIAAPETWDRSCGKSRKIEQNLGQKENKSQDECRCAHLLTSVLHTVKSHNQVCLILEQEHEGPQLKVTIGLEGKINIRLDEDTSKTVTVKYGHYDSTKIDYIWY